MPSGEKAQTSTPPNYCEYASGPCDQNFNGVEACRGFFIYPSRPQVISSTISNTYKKLRVESAKQWKSWESLKISGKIIFCEICKQIRHTSFVVADVTTLNFNVLFEIGFAIGLGVPVLPIRDTTYLKDKLLFDELGLLDTLGYEDFQNSDHLYAILSKHEPSNISITRSYDINRRQPLFVIKSHISTEGAVKSLSTLKKSPLNFRSFDPSETIRITLRESFREVMSSLGVVAHLSDPDREMATIQNARCAFLAGMAMAGEKNVFLLQENIVEEPIDYRDVIHFYTNPDQIQGIYKSFIRNTVVRLQEEIYIALKPPPNLLSEIDLGDVAAENEISQLRSYFVETGQFINVLRGRARLVVGNKGTGKTAIFYQVRDNRKQRRTTLVLDLKPEGHQFVKLRETILSKLSPGAQGHTMTAFWNYLLLMEIAHKIIDDEVKLIARDEKLRESYEKVKGVYSRYYEEEGDFSERLLRLVDSVIDRCDKMGYPANSEQVTQIVYRHDIKELIESLSYYLQNKKEVWLLIDNLDKGWPVLGATDADIQILRSLLDATRMIQRRLNRERIDFKVTVFIRYDIYEHLIKQTPDRGKDTVTKLYWDDQKLFEEIFLARVQASTDLTGNFEDVWKTLFDGQIGSQDSFNYLLERSMGRPRNFLKFTRRSIEVAVDRRHDRVWEEDVIQAEDSYSEDMLLDIGYELKDIDAKLENVLYAFLGCNPHLSHLDLEKIIKEEFEQDKIPSIINMLVWFGFLGTKLNSQEPRYSYQVRHDLPKLLSSPTKIKYVETIARQAPLQITLTY